jgi:hypothetical protein
MKALAIKEKVEKFLTVGFIYPIPLTKWVSNVVLVNKNQGTIRVCMDFQDVNKVCPKDNFLTPFINHILDESARSEFFYFMDRFSSSPRGLLDLPV